jgi:hypothetical protein
MFELGEDGREGKWLRSFPGELLLLNPLVDLPLVILLESSRYGAYRLL